MEFAIDPQTNSSIFPVSAISGRGYKCPSCGKTVTVRAKYSSIKTPYFAHKKYVANTDCDRYVKSEHEAIVGGRVYEPYIKPLGEYQKSKHIERVTKNLYLTKCDKVWILTLALGFQKPLHNWSGYICLKLKDREVRLTSSNIEGKHSYPVEFSFNQKSIEKRGGIDDLIWDSFASDLPVLSDEFNIFLSPLGTGRLLKFSEALRLGETYTLVSKSKLKTIKIFDNLVNFSEVFKSLNFYQFSLPKVLSQESILTVGKFLGREIYTPRPNIKLLQPLPRKIDIDGTIIVSNQTDQLTFQFDCNFDELAYKLVGSSDVNESVLLNSDYIHVDISKSKSFELYWSNTMLIKVEKSHINRRTINGVVIKVNNEFVDLIDSNSVQNILREGINFSIQSDILDVNKIRLYQNNQPVKVNSYDNLKCKPGLVIEADSFGFYSNKTYLDERPKKSINAITVDQDVLAWLISNINVGDKSLLIGVKDPLALTFPIFSGKFLPSSCRYHLRMLQNKLMAERHI